VRDEERRGEESRPKRGIEEEKRGIKGMKRGIEEIMR
jgi:hypothetical protein